MDDLFKVKFPAWANTTPNPKQDAKESIKRARDVASTIYALGVQTGVHAVIEWCGVLGEHVRMIEHAYHAHNIPPEDVDQHGGVAVPAPGYMIEYFCEKLGCQIKPFIKANPAAWRREIDKWFPAPVQSAPEKPEHPMEALRLIRITEDSIECDPQPDMQAIDQVKLAQKFLANFRRTITTCVWEEGKLVIGFTPVLPNESDAVIWMSYYKSQKA